VHRLLHGQINWDLIDDRMEAQLREITSSRHRTIRRSDSFGIDMYADVMQHGTAWCGGHTESDAQGSIMRELSMLVSQHTQHAHDLSLADSVHAVARIRRAIFFGEAHRLQNLQQPRVQSSPRPVRPSQFTTLGLREAPNVVANTLLAHHQQLLQARFEIQIPKSVPYGPNMTCPPSSLFTDTDIVKITTTLHPLVREVVREVNAAPGGLRRAIATSLFDIHCVDVETELPPFACALIQQFLQERHLDSAIRIPHDRRMIRVWTAQVLHAMVKWHITLHAQWRYRHTPWNALDLNAQPRGSYRRIDLFMIPPPNTGRQPSSDRRPRSRARMQNQNCTVTTSSPL